MRMCTVNRALFFGLKLSALFYSRCKTGTLVSDLRLRGYYFFGKGAGEKCCCELVKTFETLILFPFNVPEYQKKVPCPVVPKVFVAA